MIIQRVIAINLLELQKTFKNLTRNKSLISKVQAKKGKVPNGAILEISGKIFTTDITASKEIEDYLTISLEGLQRYFANEEDAECLVRKMQVSIDEDGVKYLAVVPLEFNL